MSATPMPITNHLALNSAVRLCHGCLHSTVGTEQAPRCLHRNATFVPMAHSNATARPTTTIETAPLPETEQRVQSRLPATTAGRTRTPRARVRRSHEPTRRVQADRHAAAPETRP